MALREPFALGLGDQLAGAPSERVGNPSDHADAGVAYASFDVAEVAVAEPGAVSEGAQGEFAGETLSSDDGAERVGKGMDCMGAVRHGLVRLDIPAEQEAGRG